MYARTQWIVNRTNNEANLHPDIFKRTYTVNDTIDEYFTKKLLGKLQITNTNLLKDLNIEKRFHATRNDKYKKENP